MKNSCSIRLKFSNESLSKKKPRLVEGMAAQNAPHGEVSTLERAIFFDGLKSILGAGGIKAAAWRMPEIPAIKPDRVEHQGFDHAGSPAFFTSALF